MPANATSTLKPGQVEPSAIHDIALAALAAGLSVLPPKQDGSKSPDAKTWTEFQTRRASLDEVASWYRNGRTGLGAVMGAVSGGVADADGEVHGGTECFEFDDPDVYERFRSTAAMLGLNGLVDRIEDGYSEASPKGGVHWLYRCAEIAGNTKLAERLDPSTANGRKALVETRGEGGYIVLAPSSGRVHPSGKPYTLRRGGFATIATITQEERADLWELARSFDEVPKAEPEDTWTKGKAKGPGTRAGDDYNARTDWPGFLGDYGWTLVYTKDDVGHWRRPGKDRGVSATTGHGGTDRLHVFTSSTPFASGTSYSRFGAFATLEHGGDFRKAASALAGMGFGTAARDRNGQGHASDVSPGEPGTTEDVEAPILDVWPTIDPAAFHGIAGELVRMADPETEADPVATLVQFLAAFGSVVGRKAHFVVGATRHHLNEFFALVGPTAAARKGSSIDVVRHVMHLVDPEWEKDRIRSGLVSGEGLIHAVRDAVVKKEPVKEKGRIVSYEDVVVDHGVADKRLMIVETEFSRTLKAMGRDSCTLSEVIRQCWDSGRLATMAKNSANEATGAFVSIIAHVTTVDLERHFARSDTSNGFGNRFCWVAVRRSKELPDGGNVLALDWTKMADRLEHIIVAARGVDVLKRDAEARVTWRGVYGELTAGRPGLLGAMLARAEAHVMRLSGLYALLDGSKSVKAEHLLAALALWEYCEASARYVFGESLGNVEADKLLVALRKAKDGLTRTEITVDVFGRHKKREEIDKLLTELLAAGVIHRQVERRESGGRPTERWFAGRGGKPDAN